ncbi:MAG: hypothetical protein ABSH08_11810 [Tepidisphaeraceae bacterium]
MSKFFLFHRRKLSGPARYRGLGVGLFLLLAIAAAGRADPPRVQSLIVQLGSDNPQLRQEALSQLMELKKQDLPALRAAALAQSPLLPGQIAGLRQAVRQIFIAGERYRVDPEVPGGFIGLYWPQPEVPINPSAEGILVDDAVVERIPGFPAYRLIQPGDVIVQILECPGVQLHGNVELVHIVHRMWPGEVLHLKVLRLGRPINVAVVLDFIPIELKAINTDSWMQNRNQKAEEYWNREFSVLDSGGNAFRPASGAGSAQASTDWRR